MEDVDENLRKATAFQGWPCSPRAVDYVDAQLDVRLYIMRGGV